MIFNFFHSIKEKLLAEHKAAWRALWDTGRIDIEGDLEMAQAVYGSMYYILSSTRHDWPYGLSPGGLPNGEEYMGHTFWDQDIWMYPPLVLLHPDLARSSMRYRKNRLPAARRIAKEYGYKGKISTHLSVYNPSVGLLVCYPPISQTISLSVGLSVCRSVGLSVSLLVRLSVVLLVCDLLTRLKEESQLKRFKGNLDLHYQHKQTSSRGLNY